MLTLDVVQRIGQELNQPRPHNGLACEACEESKLLMAARAAEATPSLGLRCNWKRRNKSTTLDKPFALSPPSASQEAFT